MASQVPIVPENANRVERKNDINLLPESAMLLSRVLEREARKQTVLKRFRPSSVGRRDATTDVPTKKMIRRRSSRTTIKFSQVSATNTTSSMSAMHRTAPRLPAIDEPARVVSITLLSAVFVATTVYILSTLPDLDDLTKAILSNIEAVCMYMFTIEFCIRLCCTPELFKFIQDIFNWIDMISIIPFFLEMFLNLKGSSFGAIRIIRLLRVARILKLSRYTTSIQVFVRALTLSVKPLFMLLFLIIVAMIIFSSALYFAEMTDSPKFCRNPLQSKLCHPSQNPDPHCCELNPFYSIAATFWWCIVSMTTVGYGDDYPVTPMGKFIASLTMMSGMLILALPISVIGSNFQHVMKEVVQEAVQKSLDTLSTLEVVQKKEMIEILKGFNVLGDDIDIDADELIALYDINKTGRLEDAALAQFRRDVEALHSHHMTISEPSISRRQTTSQNRLSCAASIADMRSGKPDLFAQQLEMMEEILEMRLLESEVRFENKLNALLKIVNQLENKVALLRD
ncbi:Potassium voltage-gated channel sub G member 1 [Aphanomyces cochlioides]|nr:Potassium voltage-gated channel sub G member 1 [Aphanomyces cochlioides]